ncbi:MAG: thioredoxin domain-containing protein [Polyangiaceae bacterium]|nr:thioredoxin domain-containing protein [Polyangiaceae bacterium]MBK8942347.1 thioredoxin domain-containing protein [Polyangiaceae bacterium]
MGDGDGRGGGRDGRRRAPLRWVAASVLALLALVAVALLGTGSDEGAGAPSQVAPITAFADPPLPGIVAPDAALSARLASALGDKGPGYQPRTRHVLADGRPTFTNRLILETSPYLLQHAHNPVNWHPWGDEAFERAAREGKPVLVSIGYSTCHWCHVMERESFEDEEIARYLNEHFVAVKVDREERPDVDDVYMKAVQLLTGRGGWPTTVVLTPHREPFFGGTYFPARDGDRGAKKGFLTILRELAERYATSPEAVVSEAKELSDRLRRAAEPTAPGSVPDSAAMTRVIDRYRSTFDPQWGGFGRAPKFPTPVNLELIMRFYRRTGDREGLMMATYTLDRMAAGGVYDQVGGGFHRYAVDRTWTVPHFEKMLYDNAQLAAVYLDAYQITRHAAYARITSETLDYVVREMTDPGGGFHSATDADSPGPSGEHEEGLFFTWTPAELVAALGAEDASVAAVAYGVTANGDVDGRSVLKRSGSSDDEGRLDAIRSVLYVARSRRQPPLKDDKILASWNGLMVSALARAAFALERDDYLEAAQNAASFVLETMRGETGALARSFREGKLGPPATLDDYAFMTQGLLDLFDATGEPRWLREAILLQGALDAAFAAPMGGYFSTPDDGPRLIVRELPIYDGAEPSGNAVTALNLLRLAELTGDEAYRQRAEGVLSRFSTNLAGGSTAHAKLHTALDTYLDEALQVVVVSPGEGEAEDALLAPLRARFVPNKVVLLARDGLDEELRSLSPLLEGKTARRGLPTAYVCIRGSCKLPTTDPLVFSAQLTPGKE